MWGADNWRLCSPRERIMQIDDEIKKLEAERIRFVKGIR